MNIKIRSHYKLNICKIVDKELLYRKNITQSLHNIIIINTKNVVHISILHVTEKNIICDIMIDSNVKDIKSYSYEFDLIFFTFLQAQLLKNYQQYYEMGCIISTG